MIIRALSPQVQNTDVPLALREDILHLSGSWNDVRRVLAQDVPEKLNLERGPPANKLHILITSYDCAQKLRGYEKHFPTLICDESHLLKNITSNRTRFFMNLVQSGNVERLILLTGTPAMSRPIELYTQVTCTGAWPLVLDCAVWLRGRQGAGSLARRR
jgi:SNF2 family DNA or RNA helicase